MGREKRKRKRKRRQTLRVDDELLDVLEGLVLAVVKIAVGVELVVLVVELDIKDELVVHAALCRFVIIASTSTSFLSVFLAPFQINHRKAL